MPINYQEGKIYKIYNTINDDIYVGSTTLKLCERMRDQRNCVNNEAKKDRLLYKAFREHGVDNFHIELIEKCPCNDRDELRRTEGEYIRSLKPCLNMNIAGRTLQEYLKYNEEHRTQTQKIYYENNKETRASRKITCECGCDITRGSLLRHQRTKKHIELMNKLN